jgi:hypothetical protein
LSFGVLLGRGLLGGGIALAIAAASVALLEAVKIQRLDPAKGFDLLTPLLGLFTPADTSDWVSLFGVVLFSTVFALATAATSVARSKQKK